MAAKKTTAKTTADSDTRTRLVDSALRTILDHGIDAVRIDDVVAEVGVTKGSLYWHFEDRDALVKAALAEQIRRLNVDTVEGVSEAIRSATSKDDYLGRIAPLLPTRLMRRRYASGGHVSLCWWRPATIPSCAR